MIYRENTGTQCNYMNFNTYDGISQVETWVFDLDNTLYPAECDLFSQVSFRMGAFIAKHFSLDLDAARQLQKRYFLKYGTTLRGLMTEQGVQPHAFLDYVHDIDFSKVEPSPALAAALSRLPGRKVVFTNASTKYTEMVLGRLGIEDHIDGIFDIEAAAFAPKPDPATYLKMLEHFAAHPQKALMVEDIARNLKPAAELGMKTAWVPNATSWSQADADEMIFDYVIDNLPVWLHEVATRREGLST
jgi:putative hydrolase of the HAD superfamily